VTHAERGQGPVRIGRDLAALGLPAALIETQLESHGEWAALARKVLTRRFGARPARRWPDKARRMRFLQYRGFATEDIRSALGPDAAGGLEMELETDMESDMDTDIGRHTDSDLDT
jgi:regulatory protein